MERCPNTPHHIQMHSMLAPRGSHIQVHSGVVTLTQWLSDGLDKKGPMDMCSNMGSSRRSHRFGLDVNWMFFNVICQKKNDIKLILGRGFGENAMGNKQ